MLVPVEFKEVSKWVRVPQSDNMYDYPQFLQAGNSIFILISGLYDFHCLVLNLKSCCQDPQCRYHFYFTAVEIQLASFYLLGKDN